MKKKSIAIIVGIVAVLLIAFLTFRPKSFEKEADKVLNSLTSYTLQGEMELNKGEDIKSYLLEINYKKGENDDYFKVSLFDKNLNQEQILLRNKEGVFVMTPSLNQIFRFEGEWPMNSPKPYLIQTMNDILHQEDSIIEKTKEGAVVKSEVHYPNNKTYKQQEMTFDKEAKPKDIVIVDEAGTTQLKIVFSHVSYNNEIKDEIFDVPAELSNSVSVNVLDQNDLPLYPVSILESELVSTNTYQVNGETRYILEYKGDVNFTLIQTLKNQPSNATTVFKSGEIVDAVDVVGFYDGASMTMYLQNVEMNIYSNDLSAEEMMEVLSSHQVAVMK